MWADAVNQQDLAEATRCEMTTMARSIVPAAEVETAVLFGDAAGASAAGFTIAQRSRRCFINRPAGFVLVVLGAGLVTAQDVWLVCASVQGCLIRPTVSACFAWGNGGMLLGCAATGLLLLVLGASLLGGVFLGNRAWATRSRTFPVLDGGSHVNALPRMSGPGRTRGSRS